MTRDLWAYIELRLGAIAKLQAASKRAWHYATLAAKVRRAGLSERADELFAESWSHLVRIDDPAQGVQVALDILDRASECMGAGTPEAAETTSKVFHEAVRRMAEVREHDVRHRYLRRMVGIMVKVEGLHTFWSDLVRIDDPAQGVQVALDILDRASECMGAGTPEAAETTSKVFHEAVRRMAAVREHEVRYRYLRRMAGIMAKGLDISDLEPCTGTEHAMSWLARAIDDPYSWARYTIDEIPVRSKARSQADRQRYRVAVVRALMLVEQLTDPEMRRQASDLLVPRIASAVSPGASRRNPALSHDPAYRALLTDLGASIAMLTDADMQCRYMEAIARECLRGIEPGPDGASELAKLVRAVDSPRLAPAAVAAVDDLVAEYRRRWLQQLQDAQIRHCGSAIFREPRVRFHYECPADWSAMEPTATPDVRFCGTCAQAVYYCRSVEEAEARARQGECIAVHAQLVREAHAQVTDMMLGRPDAKRMWVERIFPDRNRD